MAKVTYAQFAKINGSLFPYYLPMAILPLAEGGLQQLLATNGIVYENFFLWFLLPAFLYWVYLAYLILSLFTGDKNKVTAWIHNKTEKMLEQKMK